MGNLISDRYTNKVEVKQPVAVTGITGGEGGSFDGQLTQDGSDISDGNPLPVEIQNASLTVGLPTGASSAANQSTQITEAETTNTRIGTLTETAPGTDTASSGLNGRLQRIAQRITSLIALLPTALGQTTKSASLPVTIASDQDTLPTSSRVNTTGTGGATPYKLTAAGSTNATSLKASAGQLYGMILIGTTANIRYLKFYNKATAPTVGTDTPVLTIPIPGNTQGAGVAETFPFGINFSVGIAFAITTGVADNDTGAVTASDVTINLFYA